MPGVEPEGHAVEGPAAVVSVSRDAPAEAPADLTYGVRVGADGRRRVVRTTPRPPPASPDGLVVAERVLEEPPGDRPGAAPPAPDLPVAPAASRRLTLGISGFAQ